MDNKKGVGRPTLAEELEIQMQRSGVQGSRLKNAPTLHWWEIGERQRVVSRALHQLMVSLTDAEEQGRPTLTEGEKKLLEMTRQQFDDPAINVYTHAMLNEDEITRNNPFLRISYRYKGNYLVLDDPHGVTELLLKYFHPMNWGEFEGRTDWEMIREVIPPMQAARISLETYEQQRYLYDERAQRAAEHLAWRIVHMYDGQLPESYMTLDDAEQQAVDTYVSKLEKGQKPRRWWQAQLDKITDTVTRRYQKLRS